MKEFSRQKRFKTRSERGTLALGRTFAELLVAPKVVVLQGELGAGKTTLVKGWVEALGLEQATAVTSPTFSLVHEYGPGKLGNTVYHLDLYRLETERELATTGFSELADQAAGLVLVEWGEKFASVLERTDAVIGIDVLESEQRGFLVRWRD